MSNKLGGFLILFGIILFGIVFYWYFFIYSLINIQINANVSDYSITLESIQQKYSQDCTEKICFIPNVSPFKYTASIIKDGYKTQEFNYNPTKNNAVQDIILEKKYELHVVDILTESDAIDILDNQNEELSISEKIELLKEKKNSYFTVTTDNNSYIFKEQGNMLELFQNKKFLGNFNFAKKSEIKLMEIIGNPNFIFLELGTNKYLFSIQSGESKKVIFKIPIIYIKSGDSNGDFIFVTNKGGFLYESYKDLFTYNNFLNDYVIFQKNTYVGIIQSDDKNKKAKFNIGEYSNNIILQYNPENKEQTILLETKKDIIKIFKEDGFIYLEDSDNNYFSLTHLQEK